MAGMVRHEAEESCIRNLKTVKSVSAKSPAHAKSASSGPTYFESIYPKEFISRPLLYKWNHCLQDHFHPSPGDVYWWEEEQLISIHTEKTSFRARIVLRRKDSIKDLAMEWSSKMVLLKPARNLSCRRSFQACIKIEDAVRRAMLRLRDSKRVCFDDKENSGPKRGG